MTRETLLAVDDLGVRYALRGSAAGSWRRRHHDAVRGVSFECASGERLALVGESGSGKSTIARAVLGLVPVHQGRVLWRGQAVDYGNAQAMRVLRRELQVVFQDPFGSLDPRFTAGEAIAEALHALSPDRVAREAAQQRVVDALAEVGLAAELAHRYPHELSGGQCQRVAIARATIVRPRLLVCDEAVSALDVSVQAQIVNLLLELSERHGMALLFISHNLAVVRWLCESAVVLEQGRVVEQGGAQQVFERPAHPVTQRLLAAVPDLRPRATATRIANSAPV